MAAVASFADFYGYSSKRVTGVQDEPTASAASGNISAISGDSNPAFSWVSIVVVLVIIRLIWQLSE